MRAEAVGLSKMGEFGLIERLRRLLPKAGHVVMGIGDDTAVLPWDRHHHLLFTVDTVVDEVDFRLEEVEPEQIGWKVLAVNLSDIAAMGGLPLYAVVSLGLPKNMSDSFVRRFYKGVKKLSELYNVSVVGGDLSRSRVFFASVSLIGKVETGKLVLRNGAKTGDLICVTGSLGGSILGKHLSFRPRIREARFLVEHFEVHSMIDLSDGLSQDLGHILEESGKGARLYEKRIPISKNAFLIAKKRKIKPIRSALCDGEDFELLFTLPPKEAYRLVKLKRGLEGIPVSCIGHITGGKSLIIQKDEQSSKGRVCRWKGYQHF